jgi:DNA-binding transcriptional MocR family regulator
MEFLLMNNFEYNKAIAASQTLITIEAILAYSIANYYNWDTQSPAYPSEETLARDCKMSTRSVRRALKGLVNKGYVSYTRQYNKPNLYTPVLPLRTVSPFNEDTSGLLKDNRKDKEKIINKSSNEDLVLSNISIKEGITTTSDNPSLAEVRAIAAPWDGEWR